MPKAAFHECCVSMSLTYKSITTPWLVLLPKKLKISHQSVRNTAYFEQMSIIREVNSDMPIYMLTEQMSEKSNAPSGIRTHDTPISWKVL